MSASIVRLSLCCLALIATGCPKTIYFATSTATDIELNAGEGGQAHAQVGFKRFEGVVTPMETADGKLVSQAPSTIALYDLRTGLKLTTEILSSSTHIRQVFATGRAATGEPETSPTPTTTNHVAATASGATATGTPGVAATPTTGVAVEAAVEAMRKLIANPTTEK